MLRRTFEADWERKKQYLIRAMFEEPPGLSPIRESEELSSRDGSAPTAASANDEDVPELIVERAPRPDHGESEEYYRHLAKRMRKYYRKIFNVRQEDSSGTEFDESIYDQYLPGNFDASVTDESVKFGTGFVTIPSPRDDFSDGYSPASMDVSTLHLSSVHSNGILSYTGLSNSKLSSVVKKVDDEGTEEEERVELDSVTSFIFPIAHTQRADNEIDDLEGRPTSKSDQLSEDTLKLYEEVFTRPPKFKKYDKITTVSHYIHDERIGQCERIVDEILKIEDHIALNQCIDADSSQENHGQNIISLGIQNQDADSETDVEEEEDNEGRVNFSLRGDREAARPASQTVVLGKQLSETDFMEFGVNQDEKSSSSNKHLSEGSEEIGEEESAEPEDSQDEEEEGEDISNGEESSYQEAEEVEVMRSRNPSLSLHSLEHANSSNSETSRNLDRGQRHSLEHDVLEMDNESPGTSKIDITHAAATEFHSLLRTSTPHHQYDDGFRTGDKRPLIQAADETENSAVKRKKQIKPEERRMESKSIAIQTEWVQVMRCVGVQVDHKREFRHVTLQTERADKSIGIQTETQRNTHGSKSPCPHTDNTQVEQRSIGTQANVRVEGLHEGVQTEEPCGVGTQTESQGGWRGEDGQTDDDFNIFMRRPIFFIFL